MTGYKKIFFDTAPIIYYLENHKTYHDVLYEFIKSN